MKRRDLVRRLSRAGFVLIRTGANHDIYGRETLRIPVPRHTEINENLALRILRDAGLR